MRFLNLVIGVVLVSILSGCGGGGASSNSGGSSSLSSITISPSNAALKLGSSQQMSAQGNFSDGSSKDVTAAVSWSSSSPTAVDISAAGMASAHAPGSVTIMAKSGSVSGSVTLNAVAPLSLLLDPLGPALQVGQSQKLTPTGVFGDGTSSNLSALVQWSSADPGIVSVSAGTITGLANGIGTVTATVGAVSGSTAVHVTTMNLGNSTLKGTYAVILTGGDTHGLRFETGSITADGAGNITGSEDINADGRVLTVVPLTGTYSVFLDGRGVLKLTANGVTRTFRFVLASNGSNAKLIEFDTLGSNSGVLERQSTATTAGFTNASIAGNHYVFRIGTTDSQLTKNSILGVFTLDSSGTSITSCTNDTNDSGIVNGGVGNSTPLSCVSGAAVGSVDSTTGRVTASIGGANYVFYIVSSNEVRIIGVNGAAPAIGIAAKQTIPVPSLASPSSYTFLTEIGGIAGRYWINGDFTQNSGSLSGQQDQDGGTTPSAISGTINISDPTTGRGLVRETVGVVQHEFVLYVVSANEMYLLQTDDPHASSGTAQLQSGASFGTSSLSGTYIFGGAETAEANIGFLGQFSANGSGAFSGIEDYSVPNANQSQFTFGSVALGGAYHIPSPAGARGSMTPTAPNNVAQSFVLYIISPSQSFLLGVNTDVNGSVQLQ